MYEAINMSLYFTSGTKHTPSHRIQNRITNLIQSQFITNVGRKDAIVHHKVTSSYQVLFTLEKHHSKQPPILSSLHLLVYTMYHLCGKENEQAYNSIHL